MKRIIIVVLVFALMFCLAACVAPAANTSVAPVYHATQYKYEKYKPALSNDPIGYAYFSYDRGPFFGEGDYWYDYVSTVPAYYDTPSLSPAN